MPAKGRFDADEPRGCTDSDEAKKTTAAALDDPGLVDTLTISKEL